MGASLPSSFRVTKEHLFFPSAVGGGGGGRRKRFRKRREDHSSSPQGRRMPRALTSLNFGNESRPGGVLFHTSSEETPRQLHQEETHFSQIEGRSTSFLQGNGKERNKVQQRKGRRGKGKRLAFFYYQILPILEKGKMRGKGLFPCEKGSRFVEREFSSFLRRKN